MVAWVDLERCGSDVEKRRYPDDCIHAGRTTRRCHLRAKALRPLLDSPAGSLSRRNACYARTFANEYRVAAPADSLLRFAARPLFASAAACLRQTDAALRRSVFAGTDRSRRDFRPR